MNTLRSLLTGAILLAVSAIPLFAQVNYDAWDFLLQAKNAQFTDSLARLGVRTDATADYDNQYDVPRPPRSPSGTYLEVYFPHSGGAYPSILGSRYAADFRGAADPTWSLSVEASSPGAVTISWDSAYVRSIEQREQLFLYDITAGTYTNMRQAGSYTFTYSVKRDFQVVGAIAVDLTFLLEGFWNGATQVQDTVTGYLAAASSPYAFVDSANAFLSTAGNGLLSFPSAVSGSYYLVVRHRNHLETWSAAPIALARATSSSTPYDFSTGVAQGYGTNALKLSGGAALAWAGDINQDGVVDFLDRNLTWNNRTLGGRLSTDCTGDNVTDGADDALVLANRLLVRQRP
jgi:hypothetical protein